MRFLCLQLMVRNRSGILFIIIIIIIIKKEWQCKAGIGRLTPYQFEDPQPHTTKLGRGEPDHSRERLRREQSPSGLRGSAAGRRKSIPMCDQSTACNPDWHVRKRLSATKWVLRVTPDLCSIHNTATDRRWERSQLSTPPAIIHCCRQKEKNKSI